MKTLTALLGEQVPMFFTDDKSKGISLSQANAEKNKNTNSAEGVLAVFESEVFNIKNSVTNATGTQDTVHKTLKIKAADFDVLEEVAEAYQQNAILGHGITMFKSFESQLNAMQPSQIAAALGIEMPVFNISAPSVKSATKTRLDTVLDMDKIEDIMNNVGNEVLVRLDQGALFEALRNESRAAVLGKQLTKKESFLKRVLAAPESIPVGEQVADFGIVVKVKELAYDAPELRDFKAKQAQLFEEYTKIQSKVNSFKKILKDTIREVELEFKQQYETAYETYNQAQRAYMIEQQQATAKIQTIQQTALKELATLKIKN